MLYYYYYYYTTSIFTAELLAVQLALSNIHKTHNFHILFSDSQSALRAVNHNSSKYPIVLDILLKYSNLINHHYDVIFCWIPPGHVGIKVNIEADKLARDTSSVITNYTYSLFRNFAYSWEVLSFSSGKPSATLILITNSMKYFLNSNTSQPYTNHLLGKIRLFWTESSSVTLLLLTRTFSIKNNPHLWPM